MNSINALSKKSQAGRYVVAWIAIVLLGELGTRYLLGLGTPPLTTPHATIEYMFKPNQDVYRFGNHFVINQYGMRSEQFPLRKEAGEFRVIVFGDSVVNGGVLTDQDHLATSLLRGELFKKGFGKVTVGNVSAGSWGPGNWLAYAKEYGFFNADVVVLLLSSHDYRDNPTFEPLNPTTHPTSRPISALLEGIRKYVPRYFPIGSNEGLMGPDQFAVEVAEPELQKGLDDLKNFLSLVQQRVTDLVVLQHLERVEIVERAVHPGHILIEAICAELGVHSISLEPFFRQSMESGANPYRDNIHPNKVGQQLIMNAILDSLLKR